jgi:hypothetical protein
MSLTTERNISVIIPNVSFVALTTTGGVPSVTSTYEMIALFGRCVRRLAPGQFYITGDRLSHIPPKVSHSALSHYRRTGGFRETRKRMADRDISQMSDMQGLRRVRASKIDEPSVSSCKLAGVKGIWIALLQKCA